MEETTLGQELIWIRVKMAAELEDPRPVLSIEHNEITIKSS